MSVNDDGKTPLFNAVHGSYVYEIYRKEYEPASNVTYEETIAVIDLLIEYGADVKGLHDRDGNLNTRSSLLDNYLRKISVPSND